MYFSKRESYGHGEAKIHGGRWSAMNLAQSARPVTCAERAAHDLHSPVAVLEAVIRSLPELPLEDRRLLEQSILRIKKITAILAEELTSTQGVSPMFKKMGHAAIVVKDIAQSLKFYTEVLELKNGYAGDADWASVEIGGDDLGLIRSGDKKHPAHLGLRCESLEALRTAESKLGQRAVKILRPVNEHRDGSWSFYFADPDGNVWEALWDPHHA